MPIPLGNAPISNLELMDYFLTTKDDTTRRIAKSELKPFLESLDYCSDTGVANAYVLTPLSPITTYTVGQVYKFKASNANTGASTINISGVGNKQLVKHGNEALQGADILQNQIVYAIYDGVNFQITPDYNAQLSEKTQQITKLGSPPRAKYYIPDKVIPTSTWTKLEFGTKVFDSNEFITTDFTKLTIKEAGTYIINAYVMFLSGPIGLRNVIITKNTATIAYQTGYMGATMSYKTQIANVGHFDIGDIIEISVFHDAGSDLSVYEAGGEGSGISIVKIAEYL